jgi:hypothetical protein
MTNDDWDAATKADAEALTQLGSENKADKAEPAGYDASKYNPAEDKEDWGQAFAANSPASTPVADESATEQAASAPAKAPTFKEAFAAARKASGKTFEWQGKKYTTALKSEAAAKKTPPATPAAPAKPAAVPVIAPVAKPTLTGDLSAAAQAGIERDQARDLADKIKLPAQTPGTMRERMRAQDQQIVGVRTGDTTAMRPTQRDPAAEVDFKVGKSVVAGK